MNLNFKKIDGSPIPYFLISGILTVVYFLSACSSPSVLIPSDDETFLRSQERLEYSFRTVEKLKAPFQERVLYLQAESFYQYRFKPPARGGRAYLTEAAAAITDFPALQSLAGSLSLLEMRLRSPDSAVQLWETLLTNYPKTSLRPLTLYRLGWAYRNTGTAGLPRHSSDEAFDELIKEQPDSPLATLAIEAKKVPWKSKEVATSRSLLPGLGQIYVGETKSGVIRLSIGALAAAAILYPIYEASRRDRESTWAKDAPLLATGLTGLIVLSLDYTSSYEDAMRGVVQWNEKTEDQFSQLHPNIH
jgi:hypothetical protein